MYFEIASTIISAVICLIAIMINIFIISRLEGKLKKSVICLSIGLFFFIILRVIKIMYISSLEQYWVYLGDLVSIVITISILCACFKLYSMIEDLDGYRKKKKKK